MCGHRENSRGRGVNCLWSESESRANFQKCERGRRGNCNGRGRGVNRLWGRREYGAVIDVGEGVQQTVVSVEVNKLTDPSRFSFSTFTPAYIYTYHGHSVA